MAVLAHDFWWHRFGGDSGIGVVVLMAVVGIVACWIPAARAARIDPAITMRSP